MPWNWELPEWPTFRYDPERIARQEKRFLLRAGSAFAFLKKLDQEEHQRFVVEILSLEGEESARIEGEVLDRESLQSSIRKQFGWDGSGKLPQKEAGMAELLCHVYESFNQPLTHEMLWKWHKTLFKEPSYSRSDLGRYRTHEEPMQIVGRRLDAVQVHFEAPPSCKVLKEMEAFVEWFNAESGSVLGRAAIAHVYFESIHPFEDGNGRIGRALVEKSLSRSLGQPAVIAVSRILEKRKKEYYASLERCNRSLEVAPWVGFFADAVVQAQEESLQLLGFLMEKSKLFARLAGEINTRQEKALLRMFAEGPQGFAGGLSAKKYIAITKASKATATRDLADLVEKGALVKTGELRHTRYWLHPFDGAETQPFRAGRKRRSLNSVV